MKAIIKITLLLAILLLSSCSTMNDKFSCNLTATDSCLTIDEVNAMTEGKEVIKVKERVWQGQSLDEKGDGNLNKIWIAPREDKEKVKLEQSFVSISSDSRAKG